MAIMSVSISGMDVFEKMQNNAPKDLKAACNAGGEAAKKRISQQARLMGVYDTGETANTPELKRATKKKDGYAAYVTWKGYHADKGYKRKKPRRRAEVAFCNEYGTIHNNARPFNQKTVENYGDEIQEAMEKALPKY